MRRITYRYQRPTSTLLCLVLALAMAGACGTSSTDDQLSLDARINGVSTDDGNRTDPIMLVPEDPVLLELEIDNAGSEPVNVRHIRLEGQVLELRFAHANTAVDFSVDPGETRDFAVQIDFFDLGEQVTGQLDTVLSLHDEDREQLVARQFFSEVDGNTASSLGASMLMLTLFAAGSLIVNLLGVARGRLPQNRWYRGLRFGFTGFTVALLVMLLLPFVGLWLPPLGVWLPALGFGALGAFVLGYFSPGPDDTDDDDLDRELARVA